MTFAIECMCVVCHGTLERKGRRRTSIACGENCRQVWTFNLRHGGTVGPKWQYIRVENAYRRGLAQALAAIQRRAVPCG